MREWLHGRTERQRRGVPQIVAARATLHLSALLAALASSACMSFATVRSANVSPGSSLAVQGTAASPPGDVAGWIWSFDCATDCNHVIPGGDFVVTYGWNERERPFSVGGGINGIHPYAEGYLQLRQWPDRPFGVGARVGVPVFWQEQYQLYGRMDIPLGQGSAELLWNPGLVYVSGRSPNDQNRGTFAGVVNAFAVRRRSLETFELLPSAGFVLGRAVRRSYVEVIGPETSWFVFAAVAMHFRRVR